MNILVIDDQAEVRESLQVLISRLGHTALLATGGEEAARVGFDETPELALVDIQMPGIDGYQAARLLREEFGQRIWICALTATPVDMPTAVVSGFDGVLAKPISEGMLRGCLTEATRAARVGGARN